MAEAAWRSLSYHKHPTGKNRDEGVMRSRGGGWTEAEWLQGAAVGDCLASCRRPHLQKEKQKSAC